MFGTMCKVLFDDVTGNNESVMVLLVQLFGLLGVF